MIVLDTIGSNDSDNNVMTMLVFMMQIRIMTVMPMSNQTRVLKSDFARYNLGEDDDSEELDQDDNGWKIIQTDVFRFPPAKNLFCAILGKPAYSAQCASVA